MKKILSSLLLLLVAALPSVAQLAIDGRRPVYDQLTNTYMLTVPQAAFGGSYHADVVLDNGITQMTIDGKTVTTWLDLPMIDGDTTYTMVFRQNNVLKRSTLHFTYLPIVCITGTFSNQYVVAPVEITMPDERGVQQYTARIKQAGASTNTQWVLKHNYHVKFVDDDGEKKDVSFFGLRNDNHWRLDAGTRDMIRFRNYAANGLWADMGTKAYYADKQPNARSYIRGSHVEVFMNGKYHGFYNFSEFLDRKQMKLKKFEEIVTQQDAPYTSEVTMHGMMWKATDTNNQTLFISADTLCDNTQGTWADFSVEYPDIDDVCPTDYSTLINAINFVAKSDDATFANKLGEFFDMPVLVDYYMFINVVFGIDNACNNMVFACYDRTVDKKLTLAVWDLDATVGQHYADMEGYYHADVIQPEKELVDVPNNMSEFASNRFFQRLMAMPDFLVKVRKRYWELRPTVLNPDSLVARYEAIYSRLEACGAMDREAVRWSDTGDISHRMLEFPEEFDYLCDWLRRRIAYLDTHTFALPHGDINGDGSVDVADVTLLIAAVLDNGTTGIVGNPDLNTDRMVDVGDVVLLISLVLSN